MARRAGAPAYERGSRDGTRVSREWDGTAQTPVTPSVFALGLVLLLGLGLPAPPPHVPAPVLAGERASTFGVTLTAAPTIGPPPLTVDFRATLSNTSVIASFQWDFGDGSSYAESATGSSAVAHEYTLPGNYLTSVTVVSPAGEANASIPVEIDEAALSDIIIATPLNGTAPLTVHFTAVPTGGTGTYTSLIWNFGDGNNGSGPDVWYTYAHAGAYLAVANVTDSSGAFLLGWVTVQVSGGPGAPTQPSAGPGASPSVMTWAWVAAASLVLVALALIAYRTTSARALRAASVSPSDGRSAAVPPPSGVAGSVTPETMVGPLPSSGAVDDSRRLSERILVHLYWYGRPTSEGVARPDASQSGMARRLGIGQNSLSKALRRLVDAGAVTVELRHVPGAPRRLKTYTLTPRGESVARTLRTDRGEHPAPQDPANA